MDLNDINKRDLYRNWKNNLYDFEPFLRSSPFVSLQTYTNITLEKIKINFDLYNRFIENIILKEVKKDSFLIIDLPLEEILPIGLVLNNSHNIKPILNLNFLFHPYGLIGTSDSINLLVETSLSLKTINPDFYVMLVDYNRYGDFSPEEHSIKLNNQYDLCSYDIPYEDTLKHLGYNEIVYISSSNPKEDLKDCLSYYTNGIKVKFIKVGDINE
ncbi:MAG: normocyte-binding protein [Clostridium sp.]